MKKFTILAAAIFMISGAPLLPAQAEDIGLTDQPQSCSADSECVMVRKQCDNICKTQPLHIRYQEVYQEQFENMCAARPNKISQSDDITYTCNLHPPMHARCINNRCTVDFAHLNNSHDGDYRKKGFQGQW